MQDRSARLCWGQRYIWLNHHQLPPDGRHELNFTISYQPPAGSTVQNLRLALDSLVRRHEALRTTYSYSDRGEGPTQRVHPPRPLPVRCYETTDGTSRPAEAIAQLSAAEFRLDREWPIRACIVSTESVPQLMVVVGHHTAVDDWSLEVLKQEYNDLHSSILARQPVTLRPVRHHPIDLARFEASPAAQASNRLALERWERELSAVSADLFWSRRAPRTEVPRTGVHSDGAPRTGVHSAGAHSASLSSPAAMSAARSLAIRHGVWPSLIYTAAFTALLAAYTDTPGVGYRTYAGNRDSSQHGDLMTCLFQPVLVHVDCADDPPFADVVSRTAQRCGDAVQHASFGYDEALEAVSRLAFRRGAGIRLGTAFNYLKYPYLRRGGRRAIFNRNPVRASWGQLDEDCYLRVSEWQDCTVATLQVSSAVMGEDDAERFLRSFETLLIEAAAGADPTVSVLAERVGFSARRHQRARSVMVDNSPVNLQHIAACLAEHPAVRAARVFAEPCPDGAGRARLTGYVSTVDPSLTPAKLRTHFLGRMYDAGPVCCPHTLVVCAGQPAALDTQEAWDGQPVLAAGDGVQDGVRACTGAGRRAAREVERLLANAVREANDLASVDPADCYVVTGGRIMNIPLVRQLLLDRGWTAPSVYDIASARPLRAIAAQLRPRSARSAA